MFCGNTTIKAENVKKAKLNSKVLEKGIEMNSNIGNETSRSVKRKSNNDNNESSKNQEILFIFYQREIQNLILIM